MNASNPLPPQKTVSLKRHLHLFVVGFICLIALSSVLVSAWVAGSQSSQVLQRHSLQIASNLAELSVLPLITGSEENARLAIQQVQGFDDIVGVSIFNTNMTPLVQRGEFIGQQTSPGQMFNLSLPTVVEDTTKHWLIWAPVTLKNPEDQISELSLEDTAPQLLGYVAIKVSKHSLLNLIQQILFYSVVTAIVFTLLMSLLMNRVLQRLTRPLYNLSNTMKLARTSGQYPSARLEGPKEIQRMAVSFNEMMDVLKKQEQQLLALNAGLETEVEIRTEELRHARDAALIAVRTQSEFLANISHELRTPLQANIGYIELVREELSYAGMTDLTSDLDEALKSAERLLAMINIILDLAKCESGRMDVQAQSTSLATILSEVEGIIRPLAQKNQNTLIIQPPPLEHAITLDKDKVQQVLINLLSNACKFTDQGEIELVCSAEDHQLIFSVRDTGIGIAADQQALIFEKFRQADGSIKRRFDGTGLGLAISRHFAELMGGSIEVESEPGQGAVFTFSLPLQPR
ncbi:ATP-binding protein [Neptuniibacter sp. CAU 1671]|uniref:sensor histidine kinase n=1 Tax=Neptuniibacter sp. CAU 1671 TaxID=3032593 RepID=UPI0023D9C339|nr:ATP-binding protein [Neptuniibacter sp. CAU 1671]MDF2181101.1 ATP-binding protein [Neptuniibacter sp. CAU 1671]